MARFRPSSMYEQFRGRSGAVVATRGRSGPVLRGRPTYGYTPPPAQQEQNGRMREASRRWNALSDAQVDAWEAYGETESRPQPLGPGRYSLTAQLAFCGLTTKLLQLDPEAEIPLWPPSGPMPEETITLSVEAAPGVVRYVASGANAPGLVTEVRLQRRASARRKPGRDYHCAGFAEFTAEDLVVTLPLPPGAYAAAYRFVEKSTGRMTSEQLLGKFVVEEG